MPLYQFTVPTGSPTLQHKAEIAAAVTKVHTSITGAPAHYVVSTFTEEPAGSVFVADQPVERGRMVGIIRTGRTEAVKRELIAGLAQAWSDVTGDPLESLVLFLQEVPGSAVMEDGVILPEAADD